jgi:uncharacterized ParB-like nuclease family protein
MSVRDMYELGATWAFHKVAGGPGSGVKGYNTATIDMPKSKYVSVGTRKSLLDNMDYEVGEIKISDISHVAQDNFVPDKLQKFMKNSDLVTKNPIDVLKVGDKYHVCDGHHRYLAAKKLGIQKVQAKIRIKAEKTFKK